MRIEELTPEQQAIYTAVTELEAEGRPGYVNEIARRAGMDDDRVWEALRPMLGEPGLVHEVPSDLGPEYRTHQPG
ncbi:hypothetical protein [Thermomonospora cellulosilytica]|uniref:Uncharacterized protein n=1 Tax=Thermomonospora cellulosilytica TaxID=1411118 RepID=A0A7W3R7P2_9ACTN|nr:hypothetical protein [Thermomonospora cellulosilytica]MBA9002729.1 hypothetical protein [Thermomonospora cellulosilytica]